MSQSGTVTPTSGASSNVGTAVTGPAVGVFTCTGPLAVTVQGPSSSPLLLQPGQTAAAQVANGVQVTCQAVQPVSGTVGPPVPVTSNLLYLIGTLT